MRYFAELSYKGTAYCGWQRQDNAISVQQVAEVAFSTLFRKEINLIGAGRTDTGVHARKFIAHFDLQSDSNIGNSENVIFHLNAILPDDIAIQCIYPVHPDAHARFSAIRRSYKYYIVTEKKPFHREFSYLLHKEPDIEFMNICAAELFKYQDFSSFCKLHSDNKTNLCTIYEAHWKREQGMIVFTISADRFLRNMVRAIVGTLLSAGNHKISLSEFREIIEKKCRSEAGISVPAQGLFLEDIQYPGWCYEDNL